MKQKQKKFYANHAIEEQKMFKNDPNDFIIQILLYILSNKTDISFESIHFYSLNCIFSHFFCQPDNIDLIHFVSFQPDSIEYFNRNKSKIFQKISAYQERNQTVLFLNNDVSFRDLYQNLLTRIDKHFDFYKDLIAHLSVHNHVPNFHTLYSHAIWFHDMTQVEQFSKTGRKKDGPYLLFFMECASRSIVYWHLFENNVKISSELLIKHLQQAILSVNDAVPFLLHSDSDFVNRSYSFFKSLFDLGVLPSMNRSIFGTMNKRHGNQAIEFFNQRFKKILAKDIKNQKIFDPKTLHSQPFQVLENLVKSSIKKYHSTPHGRLSTKGFSNKNFVPINPNQSLESHDNFLYLKVLFEYANQNLHSLSNDIHKIKNLNFFDLQDQHRFSLYMANIYANNVPTNSQNEISSLITSDANIDQQKHAEFYDRTSVYYAYALGNSQHSRIVNFFHSKGKLTIAGPGRQNHITEEWKEMLFTKEEFFQIFDISSSLFIKIFSKIAEILFLQQEKNTQKILEATHFQTQELKEHAEKQTYDIKKDNQLLFLQISEMKKKLQFFYDKENQTRLLQQKRKNRKKRPLTSEIQVFHFQAALSLTRINSLNSPFQIFVNARNRVAIFILFFTGIRVATLREFTFADLYDLFQLDQPARVSVSKKRLKKDEQNFLISPPIRKAYVFGQWNVFQDFQILVQNMEEWASQNKILEDSQKFNLPFFCTYDDFSKPASRVTVNNTINNIVRKSVESLGEKKVQTYSSHSFRVHVATSIIRVHGVRAAQQYMRHSNMATTVLYDRNPLSNQTLSSISSTLGNLSENRTSKKKAALSSEQIRDLGIQVASNTSVSSDAILFTENIEEKAIKSDLMEQDRINSKNICAKPGLQIEPGKTENMKKHLIYKDKLKNKKKILK